MEIGHSQVAGILTLVMLILGKCAASSMAILDWCPVAPDNPQLAHLLFDE
jgi:hypothetical protein